MLYRNIGPGPSDPRLSFAKTLAGCEINNIAAAVSRQLSVITLAMFRFIRLYLGMLVRFFRVRQSLLLENLALRQQLAVLKRRRRSPVPEPVRQTVLGRRQSLLVRLETSSYRCRA